MVPVGWNIKQVFEAPFRYIEIVAPNGYTARVATHERNPENVLYMLAEALLSADASAHE